MRIEQGAFNKRRRPAGSRPDNAYFSSACLRAALSANLSASEKGAVTMSGTTLEETPQPGPVATQASPLIALTDVSRAFGAGDRVVHALSDIDLRVSEGEFTVVLGSSGSGKTTLLNVIGALESPTSGRIVVGGVDITKATRRELALFRRRTVSFIFQTFNLFPGLTALENVQFGIDVSGRRNAAAADVLARVGLADRIDHFQHQLSGGEQQPVAIARAPATGNLMLLADEPTGELDFRTGVQILELLHDQTHEIGTAVLVVTHNREISRMADRVVELSSGRVVSDGPPPGGRADVSALRW
jgi:putative ABC transport system ATP-binding protein